MSETLKKVSGAISVQPFYFIERNFYPGRTFTDLADLNRQLADWCAQKSRRFMTQLQARPIELCQIERPHLQALPIYIPEVFALHSRIVDVEGTLAQGRTYRDWNAAFRNWLRKAAELRQSAQPSPSAYQPIPYGLK